MKKKNLFVMAAWILLSCHSTSKVVVNPTDQPGLTIHGKIYTTAYQQTAAEYRALCYQAFSYARYRVDQFVPSTQLPPAIITDVDETILDNSPYAVNRSNIGMDYEINSWIDWTNRSSAHSLPGAAEFLRYAASKGIEIFYITNRLDKERSATVENLRRQGLPFADSLHVLTKSATSAKEPRRKQVLKDHELVLLMGDNLPDFSSIFDKTSVSERNRLVDVNKEEFGRKFILLPNPVYGDWEGSIYQYHYNLSPQQKDSAMRSVLQGY